jgi:hypothetical protein
MTNVIDFRKRPSEDDRIVEAQQRRIQKAVSDFMQGVPSDSFSLPSSTHALLHGATTTERSCGSCSMCCKFFIIPEVDKKRDEWCQHCRPGKGGCQIYDRRPPICKRFECMWKMCIWLGDEWYPARSKMVLYPGDVAIMVKVDPSYPNAWRREPYYSQLLKFSFDHPIIVTVGKNAFELHKGFEKQLSRDLEAEERRVQQQFAETGSSDFRSSEYDNT